MTISFFFVNIQTGIWVATTKGDNIMLPKEKVKKNLAEARFLSDKITRKIKAAGFTKEEIEKDVHEAFLEVKRNRRSNRR
ncbi:hypothetical protein DK28_0208765 [Peptococcaceae bacterium SCADC1_2_3]|nr:hypothetical protein DK28_0208765 [Peptococcaceae bacterium SCADC1_2_3]KFI35581.1 hypothetical protein HY00_03555 [Peptococcaceae bacterium SCADC1_2_3]